MYSYISKNLEHADFIILSQIWCEKTRLQMLTAVTLKGRVVTLLSTSGNTNFPLINISLFAFYFLLLHGEQNTER